MGFIRELFENRNMSNQSAKLTILKSAVLYTMVSFLSRMIAFPKSIVIGIVLMPDEFGLYSSIFLWFHYLTFINLGLCSSASRESAHYFGQNGQESRALQIQNKAITFDFVLTLCIAVCFIIYSTQKSSFFLKSCYLFVAITYLLNQIFGYYQRFNSARNLFSNVAVSNLLRNTLSPLLVMLTIFYMKIYALFLIPIVALIISILYYRYKAPLKARPCFDFSGLWHLLVAGWFLGAASMLSTLFVVLDRTFIKIFLDNTIMGLYVFSLIFVRMIYALFSNLMSICVDTINKNSAELDTEVLIKKGVIYTKYLLLFAAAIAIVAQLFYCLVISLFLDNYAKSTTIFIVLSAMLFSYAMYVIPNSILVSRLMRREKIVVLIMLTGVVAGISFNALFIYFGWKGEGIALGTVLAETIVASLMLFVFIGYKVRCFIKDLAEIFVMGLLFFAYTGYFYYMTINQYAPISFAVYCSVALIVLFLITSFYYRINTIKLSIRLYKDFLGSSTKV